MLKSSAQNAIYQWTSLGRPLDPRYPSNKIIIFLLPLCALSGAGLAWYRGDEIFTILLSALWILALTLGTWALGRELAPDDPISAFLCLILGWLSLLWVPSPNLLILFLALFLARLINRSTGLKTKISDSILVLGLLLATTYQMKNPWVALYGSIAFALDASLIHPNKKNWIFAALSLAAALIFFRVWDYRLVVTFPENPLILYLCLPTLGFFFLRILMTPSIESTGDQDSEKLSPDRVRAGMIIIMLLTLQGLARGDAGFFEEILLWATLGGLALGTLLFWIPTSLTKNN